MYVNIYYIYIYIHIKFQKPTQYIYLTAFSIIYGWAGICNRENVVSYDIRIMW